MTALAAVVSLDGRPAEPERLERLARPAPGNAVDVVDTWVEGPAGLACALTRIAPESETARRPLLDPGSGVVAIVEGRLDNRRELRAALEVDERADDAVYVLAAHHQWGAGAAARLLGDFVTVVWDPRAGGRLLVASDPMGMRPLYYAVEDGFLLLASTLEQLLQGLDRAPSVNDEMTSTYVYRPLLEWPHASFLAGVESLRGGELLDVRDGSVEKRRYWRWPEHPPERHAARGDEVEEFRSLLEDAVRCRIRSARPVGIYLSGGLDSSAITSVAGTMRHRDPSLDLRAYSCVSTGSPP